VHYVSIHSTTHSLERCLRPSTSAIKKKFKRGYMKKENWEKGLTKIGKKIKMEEWKQKSVHNVKKKS